MVKNHFYNKNYIEVTLCLCPKKLLIFVKVIRFHRINNLSVDPEHNKTSSGENLKQETGCS